MVSACTLALGVSGVAAHSGGDHGQGEHRGAAPHQVTTRVDAVDHGTKDDRGAGDDRTGSAAGEHGTPARGPHVAAQPAAEPTVTTTITPTGGRSPRLSVPAVSPPPLPLAPEGSNPKGASTNPGGAVTTTVAPTRPSTAPRASTPASSSRPAAGVFVPAPPSGPAPTPAVPRISLPPLVLIPPIGLPSPPSFSTVAGGGGVAPLIVLLAAMAALSVILGVRLVRRSR